MIYSGPSLKEPPLLQRKCRRIREVVSGERVGVMVRVMEKVRGNSIFRSQIIILVGFKITYQLIKTIIDQSGWPNS